MFMSYVLSFVACGAEITALKVELEDTQNRLQAERLKQQQALSQLAGKEAELLSLRASKLALEEARHCAKAAAEREAYSTCTPRSVSLSLSPYLSHSLCLCSAGSAASDLAAGGAEGRGGGQGARAGRGEGRAGRRPQARE